MITIKKFLYFIELESGVSFIGYAGIFSSLILAIAFLLTSAFSFVDVIEYIKERYIVHKTELPGIQVFIIFIIVIASLLVNMYTSINLITGVQHQSHKKFRPYLGVGLFFIFLLSLESLTSLKLFYFLFTIVHCYFWITVYSLYETYKIEARMKIRISTIDQA